MPPLSAHNLMDTGGDLVYNGAKQLSKSDLMPTDLMDELAASGKKYTPQDVIMVTKNPNGDPCGWNRGMTAPDSSTFWMDMRIILVITESKKKKFHTSQKSG